MDLSGGRKYQQDHDHRQLLSHGQAGGGHIQEQGVQHGAEGEEGAVPLHDGLVEEVAGVEGEGEVDPAVRWRSGNRVRGGSPLRSLHSSNYVISGYY